MALIWIETKPTKGNSQGIVAITKPVNSNKIAEKIYALTGIKLPVMRIGMDTYQEVYTII